MEFLARHYDDKFPGFDLRLNQIQGVHLKFINVMFISPLLMMGWF